jgi:hypothetical protein
MKTEGMKGRRFQSKCLLCDWVSGSYTSMVIVGNLGSKHARRSHPNNEGFVAIILEVNSSEHS